MSRASAKIEREKFWERNRKSDGYLLKKTVSNGFYKIARAILLFGLCFLIIQPLLNKISISFMQEQDLYDATVISVPRNFTTFNYKLVDQLSSYWTCLRNTVFVALLVSVIQVAACTLVGYGFARYKFPLKKFWFACVMLSILIPPQTISSSLWLHFSFFDVFGIFKAITGKTINLQNSMAPYIMMCIGCMGLKSGLYIYLIRQFFRNIPKELEEAAYVDGCGKLKTFLRIMLPDAKPILTSCFLFAYVWQWTDSYYSKLFLGKVKLLPKALTSLTGRLGDYLTSMYGPGIMASAAYEQAMIATGLLMTIIPLLIIYLVAQKGFVESLSQSGIKM
ncbi:MAG: carbohydrate ABC transporter permease [Lachnospiraceae bacterium]|nr:carbohydrate ABC transporter permease [Lachnospiraceae bacterium]